MKRDNKKSALELHRQILLATIDYLNEQEDGRIIYDQFDPVAEYYQQQKLQFEKYFKQGRLDRLQQRLRSLTEGRLRRIDVNFASYIKEKTGYDIDLFENLYKRIDTILSQQEIRDQNELSDVSTMLQLYQKTPVDKDKVNLLNNLLTTYAEQNSSKKAITKSKGDRQRQDEVVSPDGKRKLEVRNEQALAYVVIFFEIASGSVFAVTGIKPVIKAYWKDNNSIVIETSKDYTVHTKYEQVKSLKEVVKIEYVEV
jgi:hypothetical protein